MILMSSAVLANGGAAKSVTATSASKRGKFGSLTTSSVAPITLCVVGSGGVGKSCVTLRYLKDEFVEVFAVLHSRLSLYT